MHKSGTRVIQPTLIRGLCLAGILAICGCDDGVERGSITAPPRGEKLGGGDAPGGEESKKPSRRNDPALKTVGPGGKTL